MSLLQKLQSAQQKDEAGRRPSMAVKSLAVPGATSHAGAQTSGQRRTSSIGLGSGLRAGSISSGPQVAGPSLMGLLASKRLAKRFASRFHSRRWGSTRLSGVPVQKEPSYRMEPHHKFNADKVETVLKSILEDKMAKFRYSPKICSNMCKILGDEIKDRVKLMNFDRYKIVSHVVIGQKKDQGIVTCSRCAWDEKLDNYASYTFQNEHIFVTATVFGVYNE